MLHTSRGERNVGDRLLSSRALAVGATIAALAVAGCGGGNTRSGKTLSLEGCGEYAYNKATSNQPIQKLSTNIKQAQEDILVLQKRAALTNGQINLPRFEGATEISANRQSLTLRFERSTFWNNETIDTVKFDVQNNEPIVSPGAIACAADDGLHLNGTFATLEQYVKQTQALDT